MSGPEVVSHFSSRLSVSTILWYMPISLGPVAPSGRG